MDWLFFVLKVKFFIINIHEEKNLVKYDVKCVIDERKRKTKNHFISRICKCSISMFLSPSSSVICYVNFQLNYTICWLINTWIIWHNPNDKMKMVEKFINKHHFEFENGDGFKFLHEFRLLFSTNFSNEIHDNRSFFIVQIPCVCFQCYSLFHICLFICSNDFPLFVWW